MRMEEHLWNAIEKGKPKYSKRDLYQCHFFYQTSRMDSPGIEPRLRGERPAPLNMKINISYTG